MSGRGCCQQWRWPYLGLDCSPTIFSIYLNNIECFSLKTHIISTLDVKNVNRQETVDIPHIFV